MKVRNAESSFLEWSWVFPATPLGDLFLTFTPQGLARLVFSELNSFKPGSSPGSDDSPPPSGFPAAAAWRALVYRELTDYFGEQPPDFASLTLDLKGTPFQLRVWRELRNIPYGRTISYQGLAARLGNRLAARAAGQAVGANPIPLIIPCHRVIAGDGLGGYSSGLDRKRWLLAHEGVRI